MKFKFIVNRSHLQHVFKFPWFQYNVKYFCLKKYRNNQIFFTLIFSKLFSAQLTILTPILSIHMLDVCSCLLWFPWCLLTGLGLIKLWKIYTSMNPFVVGYKTNSNFLFYRRASVDHSLRIIHCTKNLKSVRRLWKNSKYLDFSWKFNTNLTKLCVTIWINYNFHYNMLCIFAIL